MNVENTGALKNLNQEDCLTIESRKLQVYIINLEDSRERWIQCFRRMSAVFDKSQIQRVPALDGRNFADNRLLNGWRVDTLRQLQREGYLGHNSIPDPIRTALCLSHQRALRLFLNNVKTREDQSSWALILEDDARPSEALLNIPSNDFTLQVPPADIVFLHDRTVGVISKHEATKIYRVGDSVAVEALWKPVSGGIGLEGYLVSFEGAKKMIEAWKPLFCECDIQLMVFFPAFNNQADKDQIFELREGSGRLTHPEIHAYMPEVPLIQIDEETPSVKFELLGSISHNISARSSSEGEARRRFEMDYDCKLAFATCWFNPMHYRSRLDNLMRFVEQKHLPNLLVIELAFGEDDWQLPDDVPNLVRLRSDTVCWQKEALLNHGLSLLKEEGFPYLGWLDADVLFHDRGWQDAVLGELEHSRICQVFETVNSNFPDCGPKSATGAVAEWLDHNIHPTQCRVTGFGWAMHQNIWERSRLYDLSLLGGGDHVMWRSIFMNSLGEQRLFEHSPYPKNFAVPRREWSSRWAESVKQSMGYPSKIVVSTLPHGREKDRQYFSRANLLKGHGFQPDLHLERDSNGLLRWTADTPSSLKKAVQSYFISRREDLNE